jgi:hypothetical protein
MPSRDLCYSSPDYIYEVLGTYYDFEQTTKYIENYYPVGTKHRGRTLLTFSYIYDHPELVAWLLSRGHQVNEPGLCWQNMSTAALPIHVAASTWNSQGTMQILLGAGANLNSLDANGWTPLAHARHYGFKNNEAFILSNGGY